MRSYLEYVAPIMFLNWYMVKHDTDRFTDGIEKMFGSSTNMYEMYGLYYTQELISEVICWAIRRKSSYKIVSPVGNLNWIDLFLLTFIMFLHVRVLIVNGYRIYIVKNFVN